MKTPGSRSLHLLVIVGIVLAAFAAGCGGSGSPGPSAAGNSVSVSIASAPRAPAVLESSSGALAPAGSHGALTDVEHVWITVTGVALIRTERPSSPDRGGFPEFEETAEEHDGSFERGHINAAVVPPRTIDLLNISLEAIGLLNTFDNVPAGNYGKIRIYYKDPKFEIAGDNTALHTTAHGHLDIHFFGGDLLIPVTTDPGGGVRVHNVTIAFVIGNDGLKITPTGRSGKYVMRPQVFATVGEVEYVVSGSVSRLGGSPGIFEVTTAGGRAFPVDNGAGPLWFFRDGSKWVNVGSARGFSALRIGTPVDVLGHFNAPPLLEATAILVSFPVSVSGPVSSGTAVDGWRADNTFLVFDGADNVAVYPQPDRAGAFYEGGPDNNIVLGVPVTARGYAHAGGGVDAFWITIGP